MGDYFRAARRRSEWLNRQGRETPLISYHAPQHRPGFVFKLKGGGGVRLGKEKATPVPQWLGPSHQSFGQRLRFLAQ